MKFTATLLLLLLPAAILPASAALDYERALLKSDPVKAAAEFGKKAEASPDDPWILYNAGVASYAAGDFAQADGFWQKLAGLKMPEELKHRAWFQIGNVSYRLVQDQIESAPDAAVSRLEQSREAFRVALNHQKNHEPTIKNLKLVEGLLERIYAKLAKRLAEESKEEDIDPAIEKLEAAISHARQAESMNPASPVRKQERQEIEKLLGQRLDERAAREERIADTRNPEARREDFPPEALNQPYVQNTQKNPDESPEIADARERYNKALTDFQQAQTLNAADQGAKDGEKRVQEKLANFLTKAGQAEQRQAGTEAAQENIESAVEDYHQALNHFEEAQGVKPEHEQAKKGEKEVREALEKLHLKQGDRMAEKGVEQLKEQQPMEALPNLEGALANFEEARQANAENPAIQPRIDRMKALLDPLLTKLGQEAMEMAEGAEAQGDPGQAVEGFEMAESGFGKAVGMNPGNMPAQQGLQGAQAGLARLRSEMARNAEQQAQRDGNDSRNQRSFQSMLSRVKEEDQYREMNARHSRSQRYNEERDRNLRNW
ncbi:MAG: hypothetical protein EOP86_14820 [Verrucomicrobiaceae bacterium]|nr:MAG: hypothetical protein EOP86_14820 [Verrucomicrobiaceae bacterium]